ncbi:MAG: CD1871A family CXXC motif-containing protein [Solirubrobacterales bacterium]
MKRNGLAWGLMAAGFGAILAGLGRGEAGVIFLKAIRVCLECAGIG